MKGFVVLLWLWVIFSIFTVAYNSFKTVDEVKEWGFLDDGQKRQKIFGVRYDFVKFMDSKSEDSSQVCLITDDIMTFYLVRYYQYPQRVFLNGKTCGLFAAFDKELDKDRFEKIATFSAASNFGAIYIKK